MKQAASRNVVFSMTTSLYSNLPHSPVYEQDMPRTSVLEFSVKSSKNVKMRHVWSSWIPHLARGTVDLSELSCTPVL